MQDSFANILPYLDRIWACASLDEVGAELVAYSESLGFGHVILSCSGQLLTPAGKMPPFWTNFEESWVEVYINNSLYKIDPNLKMAARSCMPFPYDFAYEDATPDIVKYRESAAEAGLSYGWTVPVHLSGMPAGLVGFGGPKEIELSAQNLAAMSMVALVGYERSTKFLAHTLPNLNIKLSERERSILTLVARGKTNWEIGAVLSISEYSVRDYLKKLSVRLETSNRTHTVARAMQLGLIVP